MVTHYMSRIKRQIIPIAAMLVAFAWASYVSSPTQSGTPLPLPADYHASSSAEVIAN